MKYLLFTIIALFTFSFTIPAQETSDRDKGIGLYRQGEYEKAVEAFLSSVKTEENDRLAWLYLGASYVRLKKETEAIEAFRKSSTVYGKNLPVYDKKLKIVSKSQPAYTNEARKRRASGKIAIAVEFGADGKLGFTFPLNQLPFGLTENAIKAANTIQFEPAVIDGKPVTVVMVLEYSFNTY